MTTHLRGFTRRRPTLAAFAVAAVGALGLTACVTGDPSGLAATADPAPSTAEVSTPPSSVVVAAAVEGAGSAVATPP